ncbi:hypothetical protein [Mucilaginibacter sp. CSA2-8R]|uniref:hypothetical protein n=1 Tax=Mucilaginibacter sp. CSA2-8R TaxID=3141542 RepID=UPI00315DE12F
MSNKSARPVKTHEEKLIEKASKAIKDIWPHELDADSGKVKSSENAKAQEEQVKKQSESTQNADTGKQLPLAAKKLDKQRAAKSKNAINKKEAEKR